jgi:hypothetical protein
MTAIFSYSFAAPDSSVIICCTTMKTRKTLPVALSFDLCPDAYIFLKTVAAFVVMVAADQSCEEQW